MSVGGNQVDTVRKTVCKFNNCSGCKACVNICPKQAIEVNDSIESFNAIIDPNKCNNCGACKKICPNNIPVDKRTPVYWAQGWAEGYIRKNSSSGGVASAIIKKFIKDGGFVASCLFENGDFIFSITDDDKRAIRFAGSKYVKSNPCFIYKDIRKKLAEGKKVLFVGLPCQSAAVQRVCRNSKNLITVDLICHGTPSLKLLMKYLKERKIDWNDITDIKFRCDKHRNISKSCISLVPGRVIDAYLLSFLNCVDYTENCYTCRYATKERVSDITLGDAWGQLSDTMADGVSLIICQSSKGINLVQSAGLHLEDVDIIKAIKANQQLDHPSVKHPGRLKFFSHIQKGSSFRRAIISALPKDSIKQIIKTVLIKANIMKDIGGIYKMTIFFEKK